MSLGLISPVRNCNVGFLPIVREYADRMKLPQIIDKLLDCNMNLQPGKVVLALIMDIFRGRSPLYLVNQSFDNQDIEGLLGKETTESQLTDDTIGRVLDRLFCYGTCKVLTEVCVRAYTEFGVRCSEVHYDTTSVSVHGAYRPKHGDPIRITDGYSKDKRPDLHQFVLSLLCVEGNLPLGMSHHNGNASDRTINANLLSDISRLMARQGVKEKEFIFIADSAMVTENSLQNAGKDVLFITRLPEIYNECLRVQTEAVKEGDWAMLGSLCDTPNRSNAEYRVTEKTVSLYGKQYRAVVVHSSAYDKRRMKKIDKEILKDAKEVKDRIKAISKKEFFCLPDAQNAAAELKQGRYHTVAASIIEKPVWARGRPKKDGTRQVKEIRYRIQVELERDAVAVATLEERAGCFVLLTTIPKENKSAADVLALYKEQNGIEQNFRFLKHPLVANRVFLKLPRRIEALGLVLVLALLIWRLIERTMRTNVAKRNLKLRGCNNTLTSRPTSYMMALKFASVQIWIADGKRYLAQKFSDIQLAFLSALGVSPSAFTGVPPNF